MFMKDAIVIFAIIVVGLVELITFLLGTDIIDTLIHNISALYTKHCVKNFIQGEQYLLYKTCKNTNLIPHYMYTNIMNDSFWYSIPASKVLEIICFIYNIKVMYGIWTSVEHPVISANPTKQEYNDAISACYCFCRHISSDMLMNYPEVVKLIWENYFGYTMEFAITYCRDVENWFEKTLINYYINTCDEKQLPKNLRKQKSNS